MKKSKQKLKPLYLLKIFKEETNEEHPLTIVQIIEKLNGYGIKAERRSLYDDIALLCDFGYDIIAQRQKNYVYYMGAHDFELAELKLLVDAVQSSRFITRKKSVELIQKLERLTDIYDAKKLGNHVYISNRIKTVNESIYYNVDKIHGAINGDTKIAFKYFDWTPKKEKCLRHGGKEYIVSPWALTWDEENYYLIAAEDGKIKHYRVDKMTDISKCDEKREKTFESMDLAVYSKKFFNMYDGGEETVVLRCDNSLAGAIIDRFGDEITIFDYDDKNFCVNVNVAVSPVFLSWVAGFGERMKIISPKRIVDMFTLNLKKVLEQYQ